MQNGNLTYILFFVIIYIENKKGDILLITIEGHNTKYVLYNAILRELRMGTEPIDIDDWYEEAFDAAYEIWKKEQEDQEKQKQVDARNKLRADVKTAMEFLNYCMDPDSCKQYNTRVIEPEEVDEVLSDDICDAIFALADKVADKFRTAEPKACEREWKAVKTNLENESADTDDSIIRRFLLSL